MSRRARTWCSVMVLLLVAAFATQACLPAAAQEVKKQDEKKKADEKKADPVKKKGPPESATKPVPREGNWMKQHQSFVERGRKGNVDVVFLGDSITQGWNKNGKEVWQNVFEPLNAANFGIGGDRTQHVLWRITEGKELDDIQPKAAVLMIGTNNMGSNRTEEVAEGVTAIVKELRRQKPATKVLLLAVFPRSGKPVGQVKDLPKLPASDLLPKVNEVNKVIARLDDGKMVHYLDINARFLGTDGELSREIMYDYLHLTPRGYQIWAEAIQAKVQELLKN